MIPCRRHYFLIERCVTIVYSVHSFDTFCGLQVHITRYRFVRILFPALCPSSAERDDHSFPHHVHVILSDCCLSRSCSRFIFSLRFYVVYRLLTPDNDSSGYFFARFADVAGLELYPLLVVLTIDFSFPCRHTHSIVYHIYLTGDVCSKSQDLCVYVTSRVLYDL